MSGNGTCAVRFGLAGLGGYAAYMCDRLLAEQAAPWARLVAVCEPELHRFPERAEQLRHRGVVLLRSFEQLLSENIEAVCLPVPIDLHCPFTQAALSAGKAVLCEKPAAGCVDDVDLMIAARDRAALPVGIGFQDVYQPAVHEIKRRLAAGEFGAIRSVAVAGCWPRGDRYYRRNTWAGRLQRNGRWILDSPAQNALAHYLHLALFLMGHGVDESARPVRVEAELYRANPIENYDTCSLRLTMPDAAILLAGFTHACGVNTDASLVVHAEKARIVYKPARQIEIHHEAVVERLPLLRAIHPRMFQTFHAWLRGTDPQAPGGTLEMARAHVLATNVASQASPVVDIPQQYITLLREEIVATPLRAVQGIEQAIQSSVRAGQMLHESGLLPWTVPPGVMDVPADYAHFAGPARRPEPQPAAQPSPIATPSSLPASVTT